MYDTAALTDLGKKLLGLESGKYISIFNRLVFCNSAIGLNINLNISIMEVHANHLHKAPGKKFQHYLFEFFMLFFAVFCGFLAENLREHIIENKWEHKLMRSMVDDLRNDTLLLSQNKQKLKRQLRGIDSLFPLLTKREYNEETIFLIFKLTEDNVVWKARAHPTDRTVSQLKNAGFMRLIENNEVSNEILAYDEKKNRLINQGNDHETAVNATGATDLKMFDFVYFYPLYNSGTDPKTVNKFPENVFNRTYIKEFGNNLYVQKLEDEIYIERIDDTIHAAEELITLIRKAYSIED